jgi:hypothetical protein
LKAYARHEDTPEQIQMCLHCTKDECDDCISTQQLLEKSFVGDPTVLHIGTRRRLNTEKKVRELNALGLNDVLIAKRLGMDAGHIGKMRRRLGLPVQRKRGSYGRRAEAV